MSITKQLLGKISKFEGEFKNASSLVGFDRRKAIRDLHDKYNDVGLSLSNYDEIVHNPTSAKPIFKKAENNSLVRAVQLEGGSYAIFPDFRRTYGSEDGFIGIDHFFDNNLEKSIARGNDIKNVTPGVGHFEGDNFVIDSRGSIEFGAFNSTPINRSINDYTKNLPTTREHLGNPEPSSPAQTTTSTQGTGGGSDVQTTKSSGRMGEAQTQANAPERAPDAQQTITGNNQVAGAETSTGGAGGNAQATNPGTKPDEEQAAQSGGVYNPADYAEKAAKDNNLGRSKQYMYERLGNMRKNAQEVFENGTGDQIEKELDSWGIKARKDVNPTDYMKDIDEILKSKAESGPTLGDKFKAHHGVGLTGLGVVGVSTLDLANSRGQQSNAQLYSDPFA